ncbi:MAG TPA: RNA 2',3'-cyclic phosphodiesterase [Polyangiales bacterium]
MPQAERSLRLFWAVVPPVEVRHAVAHALAHAPATVLPRGLRMVGQDNLHFTLHFLGAVKPETLPALEAAGQVAAAAVSAFELRVGGRGAFPRAERAKVVWLGVEHGAGPLCALAQQITDADVALGFPREPRAFMPHLTLARLKEPAPVRELLHALQVPELCFHVDALSLMRSHFRSEGARYEQLVRLPLRVASQPEPA